MCWLFTLLAFGIFIVIITSIYFLRSTEYQEFMGKWMIDFERTRNDTFYGKAMSEKAFEQLKKTTKDNIFEIRRNLFCRETYEDGKIKKVKGTIQIIAHSSSLLFFKTQEVTGSDLRIVLYRISEDLMIVCYMLPGVELGNASTFVMKRISL